MKYLVFLNVFVFFAFEQIAFSGPPTDDAICARNFVPNAYNIDPCKEQPSLFQNVIAMVDEGKIVCTKIYKDSFCTDSPDEFKYASNTEGDPVCTTQYWQENVIEYCDSSLKDFDWVEPAQ